MTSVLFILQSTCTKSEEGFWSWPRLSLNLEPSKCPDFAYHICQMALKGYSCKLESVFYIIRLIYEIKCIHILGPTVVFVMHRDRRRCIAALNLVELLSIETLLFIYKSQIYAYIRAIRFCISHHITSQVCYTFMITI